MQMTELRLLLAGCGSIGRRHATVLREMGMKNVAACDPSEMGRAQFAREHPDVVLYSDYEDALQAWKPDAVFILTPTAMHIPMATRALEHDAHVFIEKPLSDSPDGAETLSAMAKARGKTVMVGFCFRYHEVLLRAKRLLEEGAIGRLISIRALMGEPFYQIQPNYLNMYYSQYSGAFELVHDLDLAIWFAGQDVKEVKGMYGSYSDMGMQSPDTVEMLLRFEDRVLANVHLDFFQSPRRRQIDLIGWDGVITVEFASWDEATLSVWRKSTGAWERTTLPTKRNDMFRDEDREFLECALTGRPVSCTIEEALKSLKVVSQVTKEGHE